MLNRPIITQKWLQKLISVNKPHTISFKYIAVLADTGTAATDSGRIDTMHAVRRFQVTQWFHLTLQDGLLLKIKSGGRESARFQCANITLTESILYRKMRATCATQASKFKAERHAFAWNFTVIRPVMIRFLHRTSHKQQCKRHPFRPQHAVFCNTKGILPPAGRALRGGQHSYFGQKHGHAPADKTAAGYAFPLTFRHFRSTTACRPFTPGGAPMLLKPLFASWI